MSSKVGTLCLMVLLPAVAGCLTSSGDFVGAVYYAYGPDAALEAAGYLGASPGEESLVELERAMALLEIGRYEDSLKAVEKARRVLETAGALSPTENRGRPPWRPEGHEAVLMATVEMASSLALQDAARAAAAADRAVDAMAAARCTACDFTFTGAVAALAYEAAGRYSDGLTTVSSVEVPGRGSEVIDEIRRRLSEGLVGAEPEGLAPPPVESDRSVVVLLLLGRGPYKDDAELRVTTSETIPWARYLPRVPQAVSWATLELDQDEVSAELTDVDGLAATSLRARADGLIAAGGAGVDSAKRDLRHWASLPASLQVIVADLPADADVTELMYYSPDGDEVAQEIIEWPESWTGGRLFVVRRVP